MVLQQKKIAILFCGTPSLKNLELKEGIAKLWVKEFSEADLLSQFDVRVINGKAGIELTHTDWKNVAQYINDAYDAYDGFVIAHAPDQLMYGMYSTAFMLGRVGKPTIFTTVSTAEDEKDKKIIKPKSEGLGDLFGDYFDTGLKSNFLNAVQFSTLGTGGYSFVFGNTVFPAMYTYQLPSSNKGQSFDAPEKKYWGIIDFGVEATQFSERLNGSVVPDLKISQEKNVYTVDIASFKKGQMEYLMSHHDIDGIFVKTEETGTIPSAVQENIKKCILKNVCVGVYYKVLPPSGQMIRDTIFLNGMTPEAALAKFTWALGLSTNRKNLQKIISTDRCGEIHKESL